MAFLNRQLDIVNPKNLTSSICIIGAGGIGSWAALALAKTGCSNLTVMDFDRVSQPNIGSQLYNRDDLNQPKVVALRRLLHLLVSDPTDIQLGYNLKVQDGRWEPGTEINSSILISAVDNMEVRRDLWEDVKQNPSIRYYIDARMGGESCQLFTLDLKTVDRFQNYQQTLFTSDKVDRTPCTAKAIAFNTMFIAGLVGELIKKIANKEDLPYDLTFDLSSFSRI